MSPLAAIIPGTPDCRQAGVGCLGGEVQEPIWTASTTGIRVVRSHGAVGERGCARPLHRLTTRLPVARLLESCGLVASRTVRWFWFVLFGKMGKLRNAQVTWRVPEWGWSGRPQPVGSSTVTPTWRISSLGKGPSLGSSGRICAEVLGYQRLVEGSVATTNRPTMGLKRSSGGTAS